MSNQISIKLLQAQVDRLNRMTGNPLEPWIRQGDRNVAQVGNYHLDGAYGGYALEQMSNESGGVSDVFRSGHLSKRELFSRIDAFMTGIETAKLI